MEVRLAVVADAANVSQEGKLNILGEFNQIFTSDFPTIHPSMSLVIKIEGDISEVEEEHRLQIRIVNEDGERIAELEEKTFKFSEPADAAFPAAKGMITNLRNVIFDRPGVYSFDILIDGRYEDAIPFQVVRREN